MVIGIGYNRICVVNGDIGSLVGDREKEKHQENRERLLPAACSASEELLRALGIGSQRKIQEMIPFEWQRQITD